MKRDLALCIGLLIATLAVADDVGYKTVAKALASLKQTKDVSFSVVQGWTIVTDAAHLTVWSFAPRTDPSYPAVVKRMVTSTGSGSKVTTSVLCEADKASCANLVREFNNMNSRGAQP
jgi:O-acetyl-ADP-ribose deacetylase